ncbi:MAG: hypothetical protein ACR2OU_04330 [Thermomicrobiales bacterium]
MTSTVRRLRILETALASPPIPSPTQRLNFSVLSDSEVEFMAGLQERIQQTGDYSTLTDAELEEAERITVAARAE